jgi:hypothetical protein
MRYESLTPVGLREAEGTALVLRRLRSVGDFDLIFGATALNLKVTEVPVRYASRTYSETQISRFRHGFMLLRMVLFAFMRIKALLAHHGRRAARLSHRLEP